MTYGVSSSPYQAIRVLQQLKIDDGHKYPATKKILSTQCYVDDIITGANSVSDHIHRQTLTNKLLSGGVFLLQKWASNCSEVSNRIPYENRVIQLSFDPKDEMSIKILGLHWEPISYVFSYHTCSSSFVYTKRSVLSIIAKLYEPIGASASIIFWVKCFMQILWQLGLNWDDPLPKDVLTN